MRTTSRNKDGKGPRQMERTIDDISYIKRLGRLNKYAGRAYINSAGSKLNVPHFSRNCCFHRHPVSLSGLDIKKGGNFTEE